MGLIEAFFRQKITIRPFIRQADGEPIYGEPEERKCRFERGRSLKTTYKNPDGQINETVCNGLIFCCGTPIPVHSIITHEGSDYTVIKCAVMSGFTDSHLEVQVE